MQRAELVAIWVAQVSKVHALSAAFTPSRWVFNRLAASCRTSRMPSISLFWALHRQANRHTVAVRARLAIDGLGNEENAAIVYVDEAPFWIDDPWFATQGNKGCVIKRF